MTPGYRASDKPCSYPYAAFHQLTPVAGMFKKRRVPLTGKNVQTTECLVHNL